MRGCNRRTSQTLLLVVSAAGLMALSTYQASQTTTTVKTTTSKYSLSGRIVNGKETVIYEAPYQVAIETDKLGMICGGSIISAEWVLTAAHCVPGKNGINVRVLRVRAGSSTWGAGGSEHAVVGGERHPLYFSGRGDYDVAALRGESAPARTLRQVALSYVNHAACRLRYALSSAISDRQICAGSLQSKDACSGDSGGPLVTEDQVQVGLVSFGMGCARVLTPGVYTSIAHPDIRRFIQDVAGV